ncbi:MAG: ABC transporter ATP-binding protein [Pseudomonadales bacterium]|jgi:lipopolysaccharide transport system ATP-binding protein|nr:ABC transporter ATP-binding protein [Pseudomonadales bacterium]MDP6473016.1 ABC transporter ATP-binding protein [Pseudomonadales bacterium]MDP6826227.1 ABC transporter ATP-binding protein [Pseudomonadales bacterium]
METEEPTVDVAIESEGLSKQYYIGSLQDQNLTLQQRISRGMTAPFRRVLGLLRGHATAAANLHESFWALRDVSFTINRGEVVGIIGPNGAGKSTLLKVLSRITEPTSGRAVIRGRVGSLLEVGTGFHSELTGRENVYLNGSILGMTREEVRANFDEIIEFSEVGKFIDTPVKHYSSGMRVRLAFSVAAHVQPEILIVDEVLTVGDVRFRKKCMEKMQEVGTNGGTVLVVSHNAQAITSMCERAIWLEDGKVRKDGPVDEVVTEYLGEGIGETGERVWDEDPPGGEIATMQRMAIRNSQGEVSKKVDVRERFCIEMEIEVHESGHGIVLNNLLTNSDGVHAFCAIDTENPTWSKQSWVPGRHVLRMWVPGNLLQVDTYSVDAILWVWEPMQKLQCHIRSAIAFHVMESAEGSARGSFLGNMPGVVRPKLEWEMESGAESEVHARNLS